MLFLEKKNVYPLKIATKATKKGCPVKICMVRVTMARPRVNSRSNCSDAYLDPLTNIPTKYEHTTPKIFEGLMWVPAYVQNH